MATGERAEQGRSSNTSHVRYNALGGNLYIRMVRSYPYRVECIYPTPSTILVLGAGSLTHCLCKECPMVEVSRVEPTCHRTEGPRTSRHHYRPRPYPSNFKRCVVHGHVRGFQLRDLPSLLHKGFDELLQRLAHVQSESLVG